MNELDFISGEFLNYDVPKEKRFLYKYFTTDIERQFVKYFLIFRSIALFVDHTGNFCTSRWLRKLRVRLEFLEEKHKIAKENFDFTTIAQLESGKYDASHMDK